MQLSPEELNEFRIEAFELIEQAEKSLLALDGGGELSNEYDAVFRAFHNLKGSAGMLEFFQLQAHMHELETVFVQHKADTALAQNLIDYFLSGCDRARVLFDLEIKGEAPKDEAPKPETPKTEALKFETSESETAAFSARDFVLEYFGDLDRYYELTGDGRQREILRQRMIHLLNAKDVA